MENQKTKKYFRSERKKPTDKEKKKSFNKERSFKKDLDKKPYNKDFKKSDSGNKKSFDKKSEGKKNFSDRKPRSFDNKKPFNRDGKKFDNKSFEKKSFDKKPIEKDEKVNVRKYVFYTLYNIFYKGAYSNIEIDHQIRSNNINDLDAKLLTNIVYGTIQHYKVLDWEINQLSEKKPKDKARIILLMSLYQLKYLDKIPPFAILNEAVNIADEVEGQITGKFINAILRESQRQNLVFDKDKAKDELEYLSIHYNMPVWVIKMFNSYYGKDSTIKILEDNMKVPPTTLRVNVNKTNIEEMLAKGNYERGLLAKNSLIYDGEIPAHKLEDTINGLVSIQDESSQYVVEVLDPQIGEKVLDMCAAPGSKTQYIATLLKDSGKVLALDIHEHRVEIMKKYLNELGLKNVTTICYDSTKLHEKTKLVESFDKVLLDAPCLGLGVIRRKPDIVLSLNEEKLDEINLTQSKLLDEAYLMAKHGGTIVYSTCSIDKKENESMITVFLSKHKDVKKVFEKQIFPYEYNSDGFYIAKLIKE